MHPEVMTTNELCATYSDAIFNARLQKCYHSRLRANKSSLDNHKRFLRDKGENLSLDYEKFYEVFAGRTISFEEFVSLIRSFKSPEVTYVGEKLPAYFPKDPRCCHEIPKIKQRLHKIGGAPKVICCVRDGRDVMCSQISRWQVMPPKRRNKFKWPQPNIKACLDSSSGWLPYMESWERCKNKMDSYEINYDRMIEDPAGEGEKIADFLGVERSTMAEIYKNGFNPPRHHRWKSMIPDVNKQLPKNFLDMLGKYGFEV
jgi:hypothetical protein